MACDGATELVNACDSGIANLSQRQLWIIVAQKLCETMANCDPAQLLEDACDSGIAGFSDRQLLIAIAQGLCDGAGGSGGICGTIDPVDAPQSGCGPYINTVSGNVFYWDGAAWNQITGTAGGSGLIGAGSPESVVTASPGTTYVNSTTDALWYKKTGVGNTGWIQITGPF